MSEHSKARAMTVAGQFYENSATSLKTNFQVYLEGFSWPRSIPEAARVRAIIAPHAGYAFSGRAATRTYSVAKRSAYRRIVIIAPSHYVGFRGVALPDYQRCETPLGDLNVDIDAVGQLAESSNPNFILNRMAHAREHALEVQLPLCHYFFPNTPILPLVCGVLDEAAILDLAGPLSKLWRPDTLWVISSDFTHYGRSFHFTPFTENVPEKLRELDMGAVDRILDFDMKGFYEYIKTTGATICGAKPISLLLAVSQNAYEKGEALKSELVEYTTSGEICGDFKHTVSYAGVVIYHK